MKTFIMKHKFVLLFVTLLNVIMLANLINPTIHDFMSTLLVASIVGFVLGMFLQFIITYLKRKNTN
ncbi:hypothetical protein [Caldalkalibacillus mannanilyticus]|uniref:hypothetical protein n=1 Tax=Caldalkalibacillus mannanilyticus TaxID=1418 RepID=UPI000467F718|nr:hypothetical protein [Caldalkalibacillus mannanilyticus]